MRACRHHAALALLSWIVIPTAALAAGSVAAAPPPPYSIKCLQDQQVIVAEGLAAKPTWTNDHWKGRLWTGDGRPGREILVQPGGNGTCVVKPSAPAAPKPPYGIECFHSSAVVVDEDLGTRPRWTHGQWLGQVWTGSPPHPGPEIVIQPGAGISCVVEENAG